MTPEESRDFTARLEVAAITLLEMDIYRKPADLARRFGIPVPVVRYWWRHTDEEKHPVDQSQLSPRDTKIIRKATQTLEGWEKIKRYRPPCSARLPSGKLCKRSVAIRPPEMWQMGALANRCRLHGGLSKRVQRLIEEDDSE
jgi:transposase-like protein